MAKKEKKVRVEILPLKGIGGIGDAGDKVTMTKEDADYWVKEGYVKILPDQDEPVPSSAADVESSEEAQLELSEGDSAELVDKAEDHRVMKPANKRD